MDVVIEYQELEDIITDAVFDMEKKLWTLVTFF